MRENKDDGTNLLYLLPTYTEKNIKLTKTNTHFEKHE